MTSSDTPAGPTEAEVIPAVPRTAEDVSRWLAFWAAADHDAKAGLVRDFLRAYAWCEDDDAAKDAIVDCIMAQDGWQYADAMADKFAGAQEVPGPEAFGEGIGFALTALYECHDGPHQPACPNAR